MYAFLIETRVLPQSAYDFFVYEGDRAVTVNFRGKEIKVTKGTKFGVRPSTNGKFIRLVFPSDPNRVLTIDLDTAKKLSKHVGKPKKLKD